MEQSHGKQALARVVIDPDEQNPARNSVEDMPENPLEWVISADDETWNMIACPHQPKQYAGRKSAIALLQPVNGVTSQAQFFSKGHKENCAVTEKYSQREVWRWNGGSRHSHYQVIKKTNAAIYEQDREIPDFGFDVAKVVGPFQKRDHAAFPAFPVDQD